MVQYNLIQVIQFLNKLENKDKQFYRLNDEEFIICKGNYNDLLMKLPNGILKPLPIFSYLQDLWILKEDI